MVPFDFNPEIHWMPPGGCEAASFLRRRLNWPRLLVYRHKRTGNWMVAEWRQGEVGKRLEDLIVLCHDDDGPLMHNITREKIDKLDWLLNGPAQPDAMKELSGQDMEQLKEMQEWHDHECEARRYCGKRTGEMNFNWGRS